MVNLSLLEDYIMTYEGENGSGHVEYLCETYDFSTIASALFLLIFIISVTGNSLLLCVLVRYEDLKNLTNIFVLNLACSDLVFTLTLPFYAFYQLHHWVFGDFLCKFVTAAYFVGLYSSIILLTAMTVDRFVTVVMHNWPCTPVMRKRCAVGACAAAWIISIGASLSDAIPIKVEAWYDLYICVGPELQLAYYLQVSLLFFLPFVIIIFCYSAIIKTVLQTSNRKRHRTVIVVLSIVAVFFLCWGPYNIVIFIYSLYKPDDCKTKEGLEIAFQISRILAFSHCCMNPLLYMLSQKLRGHLLHHFRCDRVKREQREKSASVIENIAFTAQTSAVTLDHQLLRQSFENVFM
ncbi:chemokine XC receptor 1-like [Parambassis ranga]|uniref:Chemokine XC receptor 1-like n=1 Tax=Parambassis ranga TaxID=210632 RepID=A0A6P7K995_9TELE|nr:chemokine XC receptor 1-like [Parambassis ranga]XP_028284065.1 chemokine XC receptor 1-like [Parambassis ranga]XP_028284066.1 chemokine XC receptor 1-like [Parambassis ranga]